MRSSSVLYEQFFLLLSLTLSLFLLFVSSADRQWYITNSSFSSSFDHFYFALLKKKHFLFNSIQNYPFPLVTHKWIEHRHIELASSSFNFFYFTSRIAKQWERISKIYWKRRRTERRKHHVQKNRINRNRKTTFMLCYFLF